MPEPLPLLRFLWWNPQSFSHYEDARAGEEQWPIVPAEYGAKCDRIDRFFKDAFPDGPPEIIAFAETTRHAADEFQARVLPDHKVYSLDLLPRPEMQVAVFYRSAVGFVPQPPLTVPDLPRGTRSMAVVDYCKNGLRIRFVLCHWTARFSDRSRYHRSDTAHYLNAEIYRFLHEQTHPNENRHVVILGDLNEEPYGLVEDRLHAVRYRAFARQNEHYTDEDTKRVRLYNCAWRWLGERAPHTGKMAEGDTAGTYYWEKERKWGTPDQVIVTGSLLTDVTPYLDEGAIAVLATPHFFDGKSTPQKFRWNNGRPTGLSDHLPILGRIVLERG